MNTDYDGRGYAVLTDFHKNRKGVTIMKFFSPDLRSASEFFENERELLYRSVEAGMDHKIKIVHCDITAENMFEGKIISSYSVYVDETGVKHIALVN